MNEAGAKQQIVEKIKNSSNILVTVSTNPSVDELSAALGLTVLLNKMNKHATAVFSGAIPSAMAFLDPEKTFENTVDSLRDFIIALDKEKADHLRYKVEGEVVKIFITPYRTTITNDDLEFSQGDYNVELVLALGVNKSENLDEALTAHGRILHDATVATISVGTMKSELGSINWREENASSLSEMLLSMTESIKGDKSLIDEQIATALLTGIVAATDRFSNNKTSSKIMTMAAQLMAAGANQQLIASKLEEAHEIRGSAPEPSQNNENLGQHSDGTTDMSEGETEKLEKQQKEEAPAEAPKEADGSLTITHEQHPEEERDEPIPSNRLSEETDARLEKSTLEVTQQQQEEAAHAAEQNLAEQLSISLPPAVRADSLSVADLQQDLAAASADIEQAAEEPVIAEESSLPQPQLPPVPEAPVFQEATPPPAPSLSGAVGPDVWKKTGTPSMGGTLNATTEQAADDKRRLEEEDRNRTILSHSKSEYIDDHKPSFQSPINSSGIQDDEPPMTDPFAESSNAAQTAAPTAYAPTVQPPSVTLADLDQQHRPQHEEARDAVNAAFGITDYTAPADAPVQSSPFDQSLPPLPPLPDFSTLPPLPEHNPFEDQPANQPEKLEDMFAPAPASVGSQPSSNDPAQFKIPGQ